MHFARALRVAGIPVGPAKVLDALGALQVAGVECREDWHAVLASVFLTRREQREVFDQAFHVFWRDPALLQRMLHLLLPKVHGRATRNVTPMLSPRAAAGLVSRVAEHTAVNEPAQEVEVESTLTFSAAERLQRLDFAAMTPAELAEAKAAIAHIAWPVAEVKTRRYRPDARGTQIDPRRSLAAMRRAGGDLLPLLRRSRARRPPPLVVLCDISGSMHRYTRMFLHFLHAVANTYGRTQVLLFGTRLTHITPVLRDRDVDAAIARATRLVPDWSGGTRIGACLHEFSLRWSRRLLAQNAVVLLLSDGLDLDAGAGLCEEMARLQRSCHSLIWLNPLLGYRDFEAKPAGIRAMRPHVDLFLPAHNLASLTELARVLTAQARLPHGELPWRCPAPAA